MSNATDRRRRLLNEGARNTGAETDTLPMSEAGEIAGVRRYAANEDSVSFAVARRVLPHRRRAILGVVTLGVFGAAGLLAAHQYQTAINTAFGLDDFPAINLLSQDAIAHWGTSSLLLAVSVMSLLIYGLRRHRTDDVKGVYRWWLPASVAAAACSVGVSTGVQRSLATSAEATIGWAPAGQVWLWWFGPAVLLIGAVVARLLFDLKHCVPAFLAGLLGLACGGTVMLEAFGAAPAAVAPYATLVSHGAAFGGLLMFLTAQLWYCRRIVLEADGTIEAPVQKPVSKKEKPSKPVAEATADPKKPATRKAAPKLAASTTKQSPAAKTDDEEPAVSKRAARQKPKRAKVEQPVETQWTDGSDGGDEYDENGGRRKLSKAERKRLRKQKARQDRAA